MTADRYVRGRSRSRSSSRRRRDVSTDSSDSSSSSDRSSRLLRRDRSSGRHKRPSRSRSRSPRKTSRSSSARRHHRHQPSSICSQSAVKISDILCVDQSNSSRSLRRSGDRKTQRIAPNATAFKSIMMSTARSRDRMDRREREQAQKKLMNLDMKAQTASNFDVD